MKTLIYIGIVLAIAFKANASTFLECTDKTLSKCKEVTKGQAVRIQAANPKSIIIKQDKVVLSEKGTLKTDND